MLACGIGRWRRFWGWSSFTWSCFDFYCSSSTGSFAVGARWPGASTAQLTCCFALDSTRPYAASCCLINWIRPNLPNAPSSRLLRSLQQVTNRLYIMLYCLLKPLAVVELSWRLGFLELWFKGSGRQARLQVLQPGQACRN
eukprot:GHUV01049747.1.p1 GENE.GHUV01049747.1~~GHUV01049747.1.p1  ORF type:complete len:141 (-),score=30.14 GHUV01049747.1:385-807(-)